MAAFLLNSRISFDVLADSSLSMTNVADRGNQDAGFTGWALHVLCHGRFRVSEGVPSLARQRALQ